MKKIAALLTVVFIAVSLYACNDNKNETVSFDEPTLIELAKTQTDDMLNGNFKSTADSFNETIAKQLDEDGLKSAWDSTVASIGEHIKRHSATGEVTDDHFIVTIVEEYELSALLITITYDTDNKIAGIFLSYTTIENNLVSNETFEEISVTIGDEYPLDGILTLPKNTENPPVVLIVHGSGPIDKDGTIYANTPYKDIANGLAAQGIATLRYNKRYNTYFEVSYELGAEVTLEDEVLDDVMHAIDLLSKETRIDTSNIFLLGHSLGGGLTPYIASVNDNVKGIISMAGTLRPLYELSYDQNKAIEEEILNGDYDDLTIATLKSQMEQVELDIITLRSDISDIPDEQILMGLHAGYQKSIKEFAGENFINDIDIPILILQGTEDFQVFADTDYTLWEKALEGRSNATLHLYDGLNHLMMETNGKQDISEYEIKGVVSEEVIEDIETFINQHL